MAGDADAKKYKKRVIAASSSDEGSSEEDVPLVKRPKTQPDTTQWSNGKVDSDNSNLQSKAISLLATEGKAISDQKNNLNGTKLNENTAERNGTGDKPQGTINGKKEKFSVFSAGESSDGSSENESVAKALGSNKANSKNGKPIADSIPPTNGSRLGKSNGKKRASYKEESDSEELSSKSSEDDKPLASKKKNQKSPPVSSKRKQSSITAKQESSESSEEDRPLSQAVEKAKAALAKEKALSKNANASSSKPVNKKKVVKSESESSEDDVPLATKSKTNSVAKKSKANKTKEESESPKKRGKAKKEETEELDDEEDVYKWWEQENDGVKKWKTLEHNGVLFPPEYVPHGIKMKFNGKPVDLPPEAEEVASFFAAILETDYPKNPVFVKNFFDSFQTVLEAHPPTNGIHINSFEKCDFTPIFSYLEAEKLKKKETTSARKKQIKMERDIAEESFKTCLLDGRKEKVGNFRVEPPGLFRGRGEHPKTGLLKTRVRPEQITLNIGKEAKVPSPPAGHRWKDVVHDDTVTWLATWKENINGAVKYVFLAAGSSLKGQSDFKKFEKARALKSHVDAIRRDYTADMKHKETVIRQRAVAIYLIDRFALRNGNEKGEDEADTVGCCSLRYEHITLEPPNKVAFDFLGKDSIRFFNEVEVDVQVFKNLIIFKKPPKQIGDMLFDRLNTGMVNKYLTGYMEGLTAKVFRTYNASWTFVQQLKDTPKDASVADKILAYNRANRLVAVLCNHQRSVSKGHSLVMDKMADKLRALKYQRKKLRYALLALASAADMKKKFKRYTEDETDIDDEWIAQHEIDLVVQEREKIEKKFDKENKKREEEDEKPLPSSELKERLKSADELEKKLKAEKKKGWAETRLSEEKLLSAIKKIDERIQLQKISVLDRDEGKEISLGTSKINYLDPRITFAWCKKYDVPPTKLFSKTLIEKFNWATEVDEDFAW